MTLSRNKIGAFLWKWFPLNEIVLCVVALFVFNNYIKHQDHVIRADGLGYYNYLPAVFIYKDLNFKFTDTLQTEFYKHKEDNQGIIRQVNGQGVNKYFAGTALMQTPFFLGSHLVALSSDQYATDGYSSIYQRGIYHAALVYALLGLLFLRFSLNHLGIKKWWVFWIQTAVFLASSLPNYIVTDASFSHAYSFALISIWSYLIVSFDQNKPKKLIWIALVLGLIVLIRPINIIIVTFVPFLLLLAGKKFSDIRLYFSNKKILWFAAFSFTLVVAIQPLIWYLQTGQFIVRSYGDESFNFLNPHFFEFLFSYRKGFFVYAPVFFVLLVLGSIYWIKNKSWKQLASFYVPFTFLIYVLSSWWIWYYGQSYGSRVTIDFYPFFALAAVPFFKKSPVIFRWLIIPIVGFAAYLALVQTYQYKHYILNWDSMHKEAYWTVFLKTDDKYRGHLWLEKWNPNWKKDELLSIDTVTFEQLSAQPLVVDFEIETIYSRVVVVFNGNCSFQNGTNQVLVAIDDSLNNNRYYHEQIVFMSTAKENHSGPFELAYFVRSLDTGKHKLVLLISREEEMNCDQAFDIKVYGLP